MVRSDSGRLAKAIVRPPAFASRSQASSRASTVDLGEVTELDSSALALLLAWLREAKAGGRTIAFANLPESLRTIARLYGVEDILPAIH